MGSRIKTLMKTPQLRSQSRRGPVPDEDSERIQEEDGHNRTLLPPQGQDQQDQGILEPSPLNEEMQDGRGSDPSIPDPAQQGTSAPTLPPATLTSSTLLVSATPTSNLPPSTLPAPAPSPTAGIIDQNLTNIRGEKSKESIADQIESIRTAWDKELEREDQEEQEEEGDDSYGSMENQNRRDRIDDDQLNRGNQNQGSETLNQKGKDLQDAQNDVFSEQSGMEESKINETRIREIQQLWDQKREYEVRKENDIQIKAAQKFLSTELGIPEVNIREYILHEINKQKTQNVSTQPSLQSFPPISSNVQNTLVPTGNGRPHYSRESERSAHNVTSTTIIHQGLICGGGTSNNQLSFPSGSGTSTSVNSRGDVQTTTTPSSRNVNFGDQGEREDFKHNIQELTSTLEDMKERIYEYFVEVKKANRTRFCRKLMDFIDFAKDMLRNYKIMI